MMMSITVIFLEVGEKIVLHALVLDVECCFHFPTFLAMLSLESCIPKAPYLTSFYYTYCADGVIF